MTIRTLIIEDDAVYARILERICRDEGLEPFLADSGEAGLDMAERLNPVVVLCDIGLPGMDGIEVVKRLTAQMSDVLPIVISGQATVENTVRAMKAGAFDILQKVSDPSEIRMRIQRALQTANLHRQIQYLKTRDEEFGDIIGESKAMKAVRQKISEVAVSPSASVLIVGDTGTGKELVARAVHRLSARSDKPLVSINCAAIPETLMESVFFGHERGAFSGADRARAGLFETADGSSLFLDEIGELDLRLQAKLLRALEEKSIGRIGGTREFMWMSD